MARSLPPGLAGVVAALEVDQPTLVTMDELQGLVVASGLRSPAKVVAARLREHGWLLETGRRGVWEFAPAAHGDGVGRGDVTVALQAVLLRRPDIPCALTFQAAAWAYGLADRAPARLEVAVPDASAVRILSRVARAVIFDPVLPYVARRGVPVLTPSSVVVHMGAHPGNVRSWSSALEWLPDVAAEATVDEVLSEVSVRPRTVRARVGYLMQGLRPDIARRLAGPSPGSSDEVRVWFGPKGAQRRSDPTWGIADTLLPVDPATLEPVVT